MLAGVLQIFAGALCYLAEVLHTAAGPPGKLSGPIRKCPDPAGSPGIAAGSSGITTGSPGITTGSSGDHHWKLRDHHWKLWERRRKLRDYGWNKLTSTRSRSRTLKLTAAGILAGLVAGFFLSRFVSSILFGLTAHDLLTFVAVPLCLIVIALLAGYLPARRATRIDPVRSLRYE